MSVPCVDRFRVSDSLSPVLSSEPLPVPAFAQPEHFDCSFSSSSSAAVDAACCSPNLSICPGDSDSASPLNSSAEPGLPRSLARPRVCVTERSERRRRFVESRLNQSLRDDLEEKYSISSDSEEEWTIKRPKRKGKTRIIVESESENESKWEQMTSKLETEKPLEVNADVGGVFIDLTEAEQENNQHEAIFSTVNAAPGAVRRATRKANRAQHHQQNAGKLPSQPRESDAKRSQIESRLLVPISRSHSALARAVGRSRASSGSESNSQSRSSDSDSDQGNDDDDSQSESESEWRPSDCSSSDSCSGSGSESSSSSESDWAAEQSDEDQENESSRANIRPKCNAATTKRPATETLQSALARRALIRLTAASDTDYPVRQRSAISSAMFEELNSCVFDGKLPLDLAISWSGRLLTTAGRCFTKRGAAADHREARVELSSKVLQCSLGRLASTLSHELCHAAAWIIDGVQRPPHGSHFKRWAAAVRRVFPHLDISTCHSYSIHYRYRYQCANPDCQTIVGRHSKSLQLERVQCANCGAAFVELGQFRPDNTPIVEKKSKPNAFALFVKGNYSAVKGELQTERKQNDQKQQSLHQTIMKTLAARFKHANSVDKQQQNGIRLDSSADPVMRDLLSDFAALGVR